MLSTLPQQEIAFRDFLSNARGEMRLYERIDNSLATGYFSAKDHGIVPTMLRSAADAKISVKPIRRNITMLQGSGGNIAVLVGPEGNFL